MLQLVRTRRLWLLFPCLLLAGCGNREKAEFALLVEAHTAHPEFVRAAARIEVARLLALLHPTAEQAAGWSAWAAREGAEVRAQIDQTFAAISANADQVVAAGNELVSTDRHTVAAQSDLLAERLGDQVGLLEGNAQPMDVESLLEPRLATLLPLRDALTDRQVLVLTGHWKDASEQAAAILTAEAGDDAVDGDRDTLVATILDGRGRNTGTDDPAEAAVSALVKELKPGQPDASTAEAEVEKLFAAVQPREGFDPSDYVGKTLATALCQTGVVELLALVK